MAELREKKCRICGLTDEHTLIDVQTDVAFVVTQLSGSNV